MVASLSFSTTATVLISIDLHRTPQFRLQGSGVTHKQRMLIAQAMAFCFYLAIGALIFIWIEDWTFLEALYAISLLQGVVCWISWSSSQTTRSLFTL